MKMKQKEKNGYSIIKKISVALVGIFTLTLVLGGCTPAKQDEQTAEEEEPPIVVEEEEEKDTRVINPLTGTLTEEENVARRPLAVVVENTKSARPQSGMSKADVVYEISAEGGITRFVCIFLENEADKIGPVRSARRYLLNLAMEYHPVIAHIGGSPEAWSDISKYKLPTINGISDSETYWRSKDRKAPHNAYTSTELIRKAAEKRKFDKEFDSRTFPHNESFTKLSSSFTAKEVSIKFPGGSCKTGYTYDEANERYLRFVNGEKHIDKETEEQLTAVNIVVMYASQTVMDKDGRLKIDLVGEGNGYYITGGQIVEITWKKDGRFDATTFYDKQGRELKFNPGNTFIEVVPYEGKVTADEIELSRKGFPEVKSEDAES